MENYEQTEITEVLEAIKRMQTDKTVEEFISVMENAQSLNNIDYA